MCGYQYGNLSFDPGGRRKGGALKNAVLVSHSVFSLKKSTGGLAVPFRVFSRKTLSRDNRLCKNWYFLGEKNFQAGVLFKLSDEHPSVFFIWESPGTLTLELKGLYFRSLRRFTVKLCQTLKEDQKQSHYRYIT